MKKTQQEPKLNQTQQQEQKQKQQDIPRTRVWDCGSTLYDSFELNSFKRQLDSALSSRSLSMPHLSDHHERHRTSIDQQLPLPLPAVVSRKSLSSSSSSSKISRSLNKFLKAVFKSNNNKQSFKERSGDHQYYAVYDMSGALTTIPEVPEIDFGGALSPEINALVDKTASERLTAANIGISCA